MGSQHKTSQEDIDKLIQIVDKNGDGKLSKSELLEIMKKIIVA